MANPYRDNHLLSEYKMRIALQSLPKGFTILIKSVIHNKPSLAPGSKSKAIIDFESRVFSNLVYQNVNASYSTPQFYTRERRWGGTKTFNQTLTQLGAVHLTTMTRIAKRKEHCMQGFSYCTVQYILISQCVCHISVNWIDIIVYLIENNCILPTFFSAIEENYCKSYLEIGAAMIDDDERQQESVVWPIRVKAFS